jgi:Fic family protein
MPKITTRQQEILGFIAREDKVSISQIKESIAHSISIPSLNRDLAALVSCKFILRHGQGRAIYYTISPYYSLLKSYDIDSYFDSDLDRRNARKHFNFEIFKILARIDVFDKNETSLLKTLQENYQVNIKNISPTIYQKELERLTVELSWKSSQIEGNTYSLLETERLLIDKEMVTTKTKEEATMILNHKIVLDYILEHKHLAKKISLKFIEEIHSLLMQDLHVARNIRSHSVGITGTSYIPLDNAYQIKENIQKMCILINARENAFDKALLSLILISYIQPFEDGNKRTGRMISTALLLAYDACPLSYRSVDAIEYKKAMLLFYEKNNITAFKKIFMEQNIFAYKNYFL